MIGRISGALATLIAAALAAVSASAQPPAEAPFGPDIVWTAADPQPVSARSGPFTLAVRAQADPEDPLLVGPVLRVEMAGMAPVEIVGGKPGGRSMEHRVSVGRWDADRAFVYFQSYSGGAHCCNLIQMVLPEGGALRVIDLGAYDGEPVEYLPEDLDGDGALDFDFYDNRFLYAFASYAASIAPPRFLNVVDGRVVDVSARPGFRARFAEVMEEAREPCAAPDGNGACAAFVAAAARVGRFDEAWPEMLRVHDRTSDWGLVAGCRVTLVDSLCPEGEEIRFENYPAALRHFLVETGYIDR